MYNCQKWVKMIWTRAAVPQRWAPLWPSNRGGHWQKRECCGQADQRRPKKNIRGNRVWLWVFNGEVCSILRNSLGDRKLYSRWVPHLLTGGQKHQRVDWCLFMLDKFDRGRPNSVSEIVKSEETWIYRYDPETKWQSRVWSFEGEVAPTEVVRARGEGEQMVAIFSL